MLKKAQRLTKTTDFTKVRSLGKKVYCPFFIIQFLANQLALNRYGLIVSTKVSKKATTRNLIKRRLRAIIRLKEKGFKIPYDYVIVASPRLINEQGRVLKYSLLEEQFLTLMKKVY